MNTERAIQKGFLSELKLRKNRLITDIDDRVKSAKMLLAGYSVCPIEKIDIGGAARLLQEAATLKEEMKEVVGKIEALEAELN